MAAAPAQLAASVERLAGQRILVVGDLLLDEYVFGRPERLSREAAIPVLAFRRRQLIPGGACNPARNIAALGGQAAQLGVVGADQAGQDLLDLLRQAQVDTRAVLAVAGRETTLKTRVLAEVPLTVAQQLARIDRIDRRPLPATSEERVLELLEQVLAGPERPAAVLCSDYRGGLFSDRMAGEVVRQARAAGALVTVDSQGRLDLYAGATLVRCNADEAARFLGRALDTEAAIAAGLAELVDRLGAQAVIVTRGGAGFVIQGQDLPFTAVPAVHTGTVFDATGAGDTFIAVVTLGLAAGLGALDAGRLANVAAGLVVRQIGNATVAPAELARAVEATYG